MLLVDSIKSEKYAEKIIKYANLFAKIVQKKTHIKSDLIVYEFIFFFYALNDISMNLCELPIEVIKKVIPSLFDPFTDNFKEIKIYAFYRAKIYYNIQLDYGEKISIDFIFLSFQFISELITYIISNKTLADKKTKPNTLPEYINKAMNNDLLIIINKILIKNSNLIFDFLSE